MNNFVKISLLLLLYIFECVKASEFNMFEIQKKYCNSQTVYGNCNLRQKYEKFLKQQENRKKQKEQEQYCKQQEEMKKQEEKKQKEEKEKRVKCEEYKPYFVQQEAFYQELLKLGIPGARSLDMDETLAESVLTTCSNEVNDAISDIQKNVFRANEKDIMLYGIFGTGKSCLAQAIAIKTQIPCLFFNAKEISIMNSGVQNLNRIFEYAKRLEKSLRKPCIIIFDDLETLTKKHIGQNNHENNNLISFWKQLDKLNSSKVIVIGTMNRTDDLPVEITTRTSMIEIPLPNLEHRKTILSYHLQAEQDTYKLTYPEWITAASLARQTKGFSSRDLQNLVARATKPVRSERSNKFIFDSVIKQMKNEPTRKLTREIGTWKHTFKVKFRDPRVLPATGLAFAMVAAYKTFSNQERGFTLQERGLDMQKRGLANQEKGLGMQEKAMSAPQIAKQAAINAVFNLPTVILKSFGWL